MSAACTTTPSSSPCVSTATWRLRPFSRFARPSREVPLFRGLDALGVDDRRRGTGFPSFAFAQHDDEVVAQALPHARREKRSEVAVHGGPGRESRRGRQVPPLTAGAHDIEQAVEQAPHVGCSRPPSGLGGRDQRLQQPELVITQRLAGPKIPDQRAICGRPHADLHEEKPPKGRHHGRAALVKPTRAPFQNGLSDSSRSTFMVASSRAGASKDHPWRRCRARSLAA